MCVGRSTATPRGSWSYTPMAFTTQLLMHGERLDSCYSYIHMFSLYSLLQAYALHLVFLKALSEL